MKIYRIENWEGRGPFDSAAGYEICQKKYKEPRTDGKWSPWNHPDVRRECKNFQCGRHYCGFETLDQLRDWFSEYHLMALDAVGFVLAIYEIDKSHVLIGKSQVAFKREFKNNLTKYNLIACVYGFMIGETARYDDPLTFGEIAT